MVYLTRRERFSSAHRLFNPNFTDDVNQDIYGKCSNPNWHGHNYELFVTVKGNINRETGMVIDLKKIGELVRKEIIDKLDHKNLNTEVEFMNGCICSTEMLAVKIWEVLNPQILKLGTKLHSVKISETENNYAEYFGE